MTPDNSKIINPQSTSVDPEHEFTYAEKLELINRGEMDPNELGLTADEAGPQLAVMDDAPVEVRLGQVLNLKIGVVPIELRAHWAEQESKIIGGFDKEKWMAEHRDTFELQGQLNCGNATARFGQLFRDPIIGFCQLMRQAADRLETEYAKGSGKPQTSEEPKPETKLLTDEQSS